MERTRVDPSDTTVNVNLPTLKMKILATSSVAPIHRKAKLLTRCLLSGVAAATDSLAHLLMVEDVMRYALQGPPCDTSLMSAPFSSSSSSVAVGRKKNWENN